MNYKSKSFFVAAIACISWSWAQAGNKECAGFFGIKAKTFPYAMAENFTTSKNLELIAKIKPSAKQGEFLGRHQAKLTQNISPNGEHVVMSSRYFFTVFEVKTQKEIFTIYREDFDKRVTIENIEKLLEEPVDNLFGHFKNFRFTEDSRFLVGFEAERTRSPIIIDLKHIKEGEYGNVFFNKSYKLAFSEPLYANDYTGFNLKKDYDPKTKTFLLKNGYGDITTMSFGKNIKKVFTASEKDFPNGYAARLNSDKSKIIIETMKNKLVVVDLKTSRVVKTINFNKILGVKEGFNSSEIYLPKNNPEIVLIDFINAEGTYVFNLKLNKYTKIRQLENLKYGGLMFSPDGKKLAYSFREEKGPSRFALLDISNLKKIKSILVDDIKISVPLSDGKFISNTSSGELFVYDISKAKRLFTLKIEEPYYIENMRERTADFTTLNDGKFIILKTEEAISIWNTENPKTDGRANLELFKGQPHVVEITDVRQIRLSADGKIVSLLSPEITELKGPDLINRSTGDIKKGKKLNFLSIDVYKDFYEKK